LLRVEPLIFRVSQIRDGDVALDEEPLKLFT
jgi:hypothetical protein